MFIKLYNINSLLKCLSKFVFNSLHNKMFINMLSLLNVHHSNVRFPICKAFSIFNVKCAIIPYFVSKLVRYSIVNIVSWVVLNYSP